MLTLVPEEIERYCKDHTSPVPSVFDSLTKVTQDKTELPQMQVGPVEGTFLKLLARACAARRIVDIGTFTGYSALMMAEGLPDDGEILTLDIDRKATDIAKKHWEQSRHGRKITLMLGPALESLEKIDGPIDMVFIDADKQGYIRYWEACVPKVCTGGLILADNVLWSGAVLDPKEEEDHALAAFNQHVLEDSRVELVMLPIRDGVTVACKK